MHDIVEHRSSLDASRFAFVIASVFSYPIGDLPKSKVRAFEFIKVPGVVYPSPHFPLSLPAAAGSGFRLFVLLGCGSDLGFISFGKRRDL